MIGQGDRVENHPVAKQALRHVWHLTLSGGFRNLRVKGDVSVEQLKETAVDVSFYLNS